MAFMQRQIQFGSWIEVETSHGTEIVPGDLLNVRNSDPVTHPLTDAERETYKKALWEFTEGEPESWENVKGYGARLSAPGYMDCTEWGVFDTEEEAEEYLDDMYGDDDSESEEL